MAEKKRKEKEDKQANPQPNDFNTSIDP